MRLSLLAIAGVFSLAAAAPVLDAETQDMMLWARNVRWPRISAVLTRPQNCDCSGSSSTKKTKTSTVKSHSGSNNQDTQGSVRRPAASCILTLAQAGDSNVGSVRRLARRTLAHSWKWNDNDNGHNTYVSPHRCSLR